MHILCEKSNIDHQRQPIVDEIYLFSRHWISILVVSEKSNLIDYVSGKAYLRVAEQSESSAELSRYTLETIGVERTDKALQKSSF